jgi:hypothetical protein
MQRTTDTHLTYSDATPAKTSQSSSKLTPRENRHGRVSSELHAKVEVGLRFAGPMSDLPKYRTKPKHLLVIRTTVHRVKTSAKPRKTELRGTV